MSSAPAVLVTGFEPFGGSGVNPSAVAVEALAADPPGGVDLRTAVLPVVGGTAPGSARALVDALVARFRPRSVLLLGEAHLRSAVAVERVAVNLRDYRIADNAGLVASDEPVVPGGPDACFATLPVRAMVDAVRCVGVDAELSLSAGTFLCNEVMYHTLLRAAREGRAFSAGFVHLPQLEEQAAGRPGSGRPIGREALGRAVRALVDAIGRG